MSIFRIERSQKLNITLDTAWKFFSNPHNLKLITPPELGLEITSRTKEHIYEGMIITYDLKLAIFFKTSWLTEITHVREPYFFTDEQKIGPYNLWHHQHLFEECDDGVIVKDIVHYSLPFGPVGSIANRIFVRKYLIDIFDFRKDFLDGHFPSKL